MLTVDIRLSEVVLGPGASGDLLRGWARGPWARRNSIFPAGLAGPRALIPETPGRRLHTGRGKERARMLPIRKLPSEFPVVKEGDTRG